MHALFPPEIDAGLKAGGGIQATSATFAENAEPIDRGEKSRCDLNAVGPDKLFATNETLWRWSLSSLSCRRSFYLPF